MGLSTFLARCVSAGRLGHKTWHHCRRTCTLGKPSPHGSGHDCGTWLWRTEVHGGHDAQGNAEILWAALRLRVLNRIITSLDTKQLFLVLPGWILHSCHRSCNSAHVYGRLHSTSSLIWLHFFFPRSWISVAEIYTRLSHSLHCLNVGLHFWAPFQLLLPWATTLFAQSRGSAALYTHNSPKYISDFSSQKLSP